MIKLISIDGGDATAKRVTLYADTKAEVGSTGAETTVDDFGGTLGTASLIYTSAFEVGILDSNDEWVWNA